MGNIAFFPEKCVFINLLGPIEKNACLAQFLSKDILDPY